MRALFGSSAKYRSACAPSDTSSASCFSRKAKLGEAGEGTGGRVYRVPELSVLGTFLSLVAATAAARERKPVDEVDSTSMALWNQAIDLQKHFNDILFRIRSFFF